MAVYVMLQSTVVTQLKLFDNHSRPLTKLDVQNEFEKEAKLLSS